MKDAFNFDGLLKDLFQRDRPRFLRRLTGGVKIKAFLNVELHRVLERRVDLAILLENGTIVHIELQSTNDRKIKYRMVTYYGLLKETYGCPVKQVILYVGRRRLTMPSRVEEDGNLVAFGLMDMRSFDAGALMATGNPADLALAVLAHGGHERLTEILQQAAKLKGARRARVLAQILVLAGLRGVEAKVQWKMKELGMVIDISKNSVLMKWQREFIAEGLEKGRVKGLEQGREQGRELGRAETLEKILRDLMSAKFGPIPKWTSDRIAKATPASLERWSKKLLEAKSIEEVVGKRRLSS